MQVESEELSVHRRKVKATEIETLAKFKTSFELTLFGVDFPCRATLKSIYMVSFLFAPPPNTDYLDKSSSRCDHKAIKAVVPNLGSMNEKSHNSE